jgi:hypothetical protein
MESLGMFGPVKSVKTVRSASKNKNKGGIVVMKNLVLKKKTASEDWKLEGLKKTHTDQKKQGQGHGHEPEKHQVKDFIHGNVLELALMEERNRKKKHDEEEHAQALAAKETQSKVVHTAPTGKVILQQVGVKEWEWQPERRVVPPPPPQAEILFPAGLDPEATSFHIEFSGDLKPTYDLIPVYEDGRYVQPRNPVPVPPPKLATRKPIQRPWQQNAKRPDNKHHPTRLKHHSSKK